MSLDIGARQVERRDGRKVFVTVSDTILQDFQATQAIREVLVEVGVDFSKMDSFIVFDHEEICKMTRKFKELFEKEVDGDRKEILRKLGIFFAYCYQKYYYVTIG